MGARFTARATFVFGALALVGETFSKTPAQHRMRTFGVVHVVTVGLTREDCVQTMMDVVIPLRVEALRSALRSQPARLVRAVFQYEVDRPLPAGPGADALRDFGQKMDCAVVLNRMHGIETQAIEVIFLQPVEDVVDEEIADRAAVRPVVVDPRTPRGVMTFRKELTGVGVEIISLGPEMVVDDIEHYRDAMAVRGCYQ